MLFLWMTDTQKGTPGWAAGAAQQQVTHRRAQNDQDGKGTWQVEPLRAQAWDRGAPDSTPSSATPSREAGPVTPPLERRLGG